MNKILDLVSENEKMMDEIKAHNDKMKSKNDKMIKNLKKKNEELKNACSNIDICNDKYLNGKIYKISVVGDDEYIIKSTTMALNDISKKENETVELIENYPCINFSELKQREYFYTKNYKKIEKINNDKNDAIIKETIVKDAIVKETQTSIKTFVRKCLNYSNNKKDHITKKEIFEKYRAFCEENSYRCSPRKELLAYLQDAGYETRLLNGYDIFSNIICKLPEEK